MLQESARVAYAFRDSVLITAAYQAALELKCPSRKVAFVRALASERAADERLAPLGNYHTAIGNAGPCRAGRSRPPCAVPETGQRLRYRRLA